MIVSKPLLQRHAIQRAVRRYDIQQFAGVHVFLIMHNRADKRGDYLRVVSRRHFDTSVLQFLQTGLPSVHGGFIDLLK